jgi:pimeloyl-ACP methyl ester carboxylesterase
LPNRHTFRSRGGLVGYCVIDWISTTSVMTLVESVARMAGLFLIFFFAATIFACSVQRKLIYYPERVDPAAVLPQAEREGLSPWLDAEGNFIGWQRRQGTGVPILILHGNAGHSLHRRYIISRLRDAGLTPPIFILEYPGYGGRPGASSETSLVAAAVDAIDLVGSQVILLGESLGTGVACAAASQRSDSVRGLLLVTPFDSLTSVAKKHYPWAPVGLILKDRYDSSRALQKIRLPLAMIVAEGDDIVPEDAAIRLFEAFSGPKKLWRVRGSGHNQVLDDISDSELRAACEFALGI